MGTDYIKESHRNGCQKVRDRVRDEKITTITTHRAPKRSKILNLIYEFATCFMSTSVLFADHDVVGGGGLLN